MTVVDKIYNMLSDGKISDLAEMKEWFKMEEEQQLMKAIMYTLDEDGHTGEWKIKFAKDYLKKINEGYDFSNKNVKRELGGKTL
jgi:hypothetical protein